MTQDDTLTALKNLVDATQALYQAGRIPAETWLQARAVIRKAQS